MPWRLLPDESLRQSDIEACGDHSKGLETIRLGEIPKWRKISGTVGIERRTARHFLALAVVLAMLLAVLSSAFALDPSLDISQYAHTAWKVRDGFAKGEITAIAQTPDGYLWLGTEFGLLRFDGVRAVPWQPPRGEQLPSGFIFRLLGARDGTLWIGTLKGLASW